MNIPKQSHVAPIISEAESLDIITLKNVVALDIVEGNENMLKAFGLLDDGNRRITLNRDLSIDSLRQRIEELKAANNAEASSRDDDNDLEKKNRLATTALLKKLSDDFGKDFAKVDIIEDDTDEWIKELEANSNVKAMFDESQLGFYKIEQPSKEIKLQPETTTAPIDAPMTNKVEQTEILSSQEVPSTQPTEPMPPSSQADPEQHQQQPQSQLPQLPQESKETNDVEMNDV